MSDTPTVSHLRPERDATRGETFAKLIVKARRDKGWTQETLIDQAGISRSTLLRWEAGDAQAPNPDHIRAVCKALGIEQADALLALGYLAADELAPAA